MNLGIWLVPVLAGYSVLRFSHVWKRSFTSTAGYEFFFSAALVGSLLLMVARLLAWFGEVMGAGTTALWIFWKEYADFDYSGTLAVVVLLALAVTAVTNLAITDQDAASRWVEKNESRIGWMLRMSLEKFWLVEIATKTGKSYVGYVIRMPGQWDPRPEDVALAPAASGYRRADTRRLELTRFYAEFSDPHEYLVVLPLTNVVSICRFDPEVYREAENA